jgi:hypothetical protein
MQHLAHHIGSSGGAHPARHFHIATRAPVASIRVRPPGLNQRRSARRQGGDSASSPCAGRGSRAGDGEEDGQAYLGDSKTSSREISRRSKAERVASGSKGGRKKSRRGDEKSRAYAELLSRRGCNGSLNTEGAGGRAGFCSGGNLESGRRVSRRSGTSVGNEEADDGEGRGSARGRGCGRAVAWVGFARREASTAGASHSGRGKGREERNTRQVNGRCATHPTARPG